MPEMTRMLDPLDALVQGASTDVIRIGFAVPTSGQLGLTAPGAINSGILAANRINAAGGIGGKRVELVTIDAGRAPSIVAAGVDELIAAGAIHAVCGYHTSDVLRQTEKVTAGRVPYVFTAPHEGGKRRSGVVMLGNSPRRQLAPVVSFFGGSRSLQRWALVGNDYIWPWAMHATAEEMLRQQGTEIVLREELPFGTLDPESLIERIARSRAQAILLSLVGRDLATFNRAFRESKLADRVLRVSGALEETGLLEVGGDTSGELYSTMHWFAGADGDDEFSSAYHARWGAGAPPPSAYAQGCFEGIRYLGESLSPDRKALPKRARPVGAVSKLARADGLSFSLV